MAIEPTIIVILWCYRPFNSSLSLSLVSYYKISDRKNYRLFRCLHTVHVTVCLCVCLLSHFIFDRTIVNSYNTCVCFSLILFWVCSFIMHIWSYHLRAIHTNCDEIKSFFCSFIRSIISMETLKCTNIKCVFCNFSFAGSIISFKKALSWCEAWSDWQIALSKLIKWIIIVAGLQCRSNLPLIAWMQCK